MANQINIFNPDELEQVVRSVVTELLEKVEHTSQPEKLLISRQEAAEELGISLVTLHDWVKKGFLPKPTKIGNRSYYLYEDFKAVLTNLSKKS